jgi:quinoprotein glucose dehydrogenase
MRKLPGLLALACLIAAPAFAWEHWGGDRGGTRFSPLAAITPANVGNLVTAWQFRTGDLDTRPAEAMSRTKFQATPLFVEDSVIFCSPFNEVIALDPGSGAEMWRFDPKIDISYRVANRYNCRGVAYWVDEHAAVGALCRSRIVTNTNDARLIALDAKTGAPCADFGSNGEIKIDIGMPLEWPGEFQITSAPLVSRGVIVVGSAIADNRRVDAPPGTVRAFDARSGRPRWSFDPLVHDGIVAGHANVWAPMSADEERGLVFLPTGSASPDFWGGKRPGNNAHANSVVALRAETGELVWSFQTVHHDLWDYDVPAQPTLARVDTGDGLRDVVIQPTKQGFLFVLDRDSGKPVWPVEERSVPQGGAEGEALSPTQPFPTHVPLLAPQTIAADDVFGLIPFRDRAACREQLATARNDGLYTPPSTQGTILFPFTGGGVNWGGAAFDSQNQILYANTSRAVHVVKLIPRADAENFKPPPGVDFGAQRGAPFAMTRTVATSPLGMPCNKPPLGRAGRGRPEGRKDSLAVVGRHRGGSRAARHGVQLGHAAFQRRADHRGRSCFHRRTGCLPARFRRKIRRRAVAGQVAGARRRQSDDLQLEWRAIRRHRRRRSFRGRHLDRRQRGGVSAGAGGRVAVAVVAHHRSPRRPVLGRGGRGCDRICRDAVVATPCEAEGRAASQRLIERHADPPVTAPH